MYFYILIVAAIILIIYFVFFDAKKESPKKTTAFVQEKDTIADDGYRGDTTSPTWQYSKYVGNKTQATLEGIVLDNYLFGVAAVSVNGHQSTVVFPSKVLR